MHHVASQPSNPFLIKSPIIELMLFILLMTMEMVMFMTVSTAPILTEQWFRSTLLHNEAAFNMQNLIHMKQNYLQKWGYDRVSPIS